MFQYLWPLPKKLQVQCFTFFCGYSNVLHGSEFLFAFVAFPVGGEQISAIGRGICVLLGISLEDTQKELEHM